MLHARVEDWGPVDAATGQYDVASTFQYSIKTAHMQRLCKTKQTANVTLSTLRGERMLPPGANKEDSETEHTSLLELLEGLPDSRAFETWRRYEAAVLLPLLEQALVMMQRKAILQTRFWVLGFGFWVLDFGFRI
jgi:hypothetical protein